MNINTAAEIKKAARTPRKPKAAAPLITVEEIAFPEGPTVAEVLDEAGVEFTVTDAQIEKASTKTAADIEWRRAKNQRLVDAVRAHAVEHYTEGGWDVVVEAWTDQQIIDLVHRCRTEAGAVAKVAEAAGVFDQVRADVQAEAF